MRIQLIDKVRELVTQHVELFGRNDGLVCALEKGTQTVGK